MKAGTRVLISEDCREGGKATGQTGVYEGDFPRTVTFGYQIQADDKVDWKPGEFYYDAYKSGLLKLKDGRPANEIYEEWEQGKECPRPFFAMPMTNPRIRLDDGSVIWGCQCWWGPVVDGMTLEKAQEETEKTKLVLSTMMQAIEDKMQETQDK